MAKLLNVSYRTLVRWDENGTLTAYRTPTNRRYYTEEQYLMHIGKYTNPLEGLSDEDKKLVMALINRLKKE
ncbi:MerR family DNA-binding transcriptional regulator (plasmid) [Limosilactobacillus reuteri]|uniref:MerR family DNA-binding transcriptional regulator n=1 Tax=Limosilactobacillus reuteri TaxID=1598 RepID=A0A517D8A4_LIMRT|nr:MerR family DNA-binding transcriptional regulator [Limosilactobacillus reuteri]